MQTAILSKKLSDTSFQSFQSKTKQNTFNTVMMLYLTR